MKKRLMLAAVLSVCILCSVAVGAVNAADRDYQCTINYIGAGRDGVGIFNLTCPGYSATAKWFISEAASSKSFLAIALTALSMGSGVYIIIDQALGEWQPIKQFYAMPQ